MLLFFKLYHHAKLKNLSQVSLVGKPLKFISHHIGVADCTQNYSYRGKVPSNRHDIHTLTESLHHLTYKEMIYSYNLTQHISQAHVLIPGNLIVLRGGTVTL